MKRYSGWDILESDKQLSTSQDHLVLASREWACQISRLAHDRHCSDIVILELFDLSPVAKHFVIATGTSDQQIRSVASEMADLGKKKNFPAYKQAGLQQGKWVVIDFIDVVVHLFESDFRNFYDLELLWGDAPKISWQTHETH